jgi:cytochrome c oxidase subunit 2
MFSLGMDWFHNFNCFLLVIIIFFVFFSGFFIFISKDLIKLYLSYSVLEFYGCFFPILILSLQMIFSLIFLFEFGWLGILSDLRVKIIAHQWYWTYEIGSFFGLEFDSYLKLEDFFFLGDYRLLEVDNRLVLPVELVVSFILTSTDVIHSWTLPCFFLKLDVLGGLISFFGFRFFDVGLFFGQCSEICGANHSYMPIVLEITLFDFFKRWLLFLAFYFRIKFLIVV